MSSSASLLFILGIIAAVSAPFFMVLGLLIWDNHWTGSAFSLNMCKCLLAACGFLCITVLTTTTATNNSSIFDDDDDGSSSSSSPFTMKNVGMLMVSSTLGILIGDWTWLEGIRLLGTRKVVVMDSLKPFLAALLGRIFLGEKLRVAAFGGLVMTVMGTTMVGLEKEQYYNEEGDSSASSDDDGDEVDDDEFDNEKIEGQNDILPPTETDTLISSPPGKNNNNNNTNTITEKENPRRIDSYAERRRQRKQPMKEIQIGMFWSLSNVLLHTFGALITKKYGAGMTTWEINLIRFGFAGLAMLAVSLYMKATTSRWGWRRRRRQQQQGQQPQQFLLPDDNNSSSTTTNTIENKEVEAKEEWFELPELNSWTLWMRIVLGVLLVSFLQPALTNFAMFQIALALLLTLESIGPIYSLPLAYMLQNEKPTVRAIAGACLAVGGIILLAFKGMPADDR